MSLFRRLKNGLVLVLTPLFFAQMLNWNGPVRKKEEERIEQFSIPDIFSILFALPCSYYVIRCEAQFRIDLSLTTADFQPEKLFHMNKLSFNECRKN